MEIAKCPACGTEIKPEDLESDQLRLILAVGALIGSASVLGMLIELPEYDGAREGYEERLAEITETVQRTVDDFADWGEAYDA